MIPVTVVVALTIKVVWVLIVDVHIIHFCLLPYDNPVKYQCWVYIAE